MLWVRTVLLVGLAPSAVAGAPADRVPTPRAETCVAFDADPDEYEMVSANGLGYPEVRASLNAVLPAALYCGQPAGMSSVHLTFDLTIGCNGLVSEVEQIDTGGAPADYVGCVQSVIAKADFPAHDMADGMMVTYPVNVNW